MRPNGERAKPANRFFNYRRRPNAGSAGKKSAIRTCKRKFKYPSKEVANGVIVERKDIWTHPVEAYRCKVCGYWHIGGAVLNRNHSSPYRQIEEFIELGDRAMSHLSNENTVVRKRHYTLMGTRRFFIYERVRSAYALRTGIKFKDIRALDRVLAVEEERRGSQASR